MSFISFLTSYIQSEYEGALSILLLGVSLNKYKIKG
ncbi:hypothetical protein Xish_00072 [Xenorhabdus ishibashii]|uniref:Uncharacterized protein n=1 Tax=Xenorhabdus ishibashii TaxID=1034471 RepID=A0A2D0KBY0_9GAMM|nr:hypothetical protein Xish_00072 [Xenorhabdus ishibashii]